MTTLADIRYLPDADVDAYLDLALRDLLSTCFTKPQDHVFKHRRYFNEMPAHRWLVRDEHDGRLVAHIAVHERVLLAGADTFVVGGIAEVCVHPSHQGRGYVKQLVAATHDWMSARGWSFSILFGESRYYASSGYVPVDNLFLAPTAPDGSKLRVEAGGALVCRLGDTPWPSVPATIPGPIF